MQDLCKWGGRKECLARRYFAFRSRDAGIWRIERGKTTLNLLNSPKMISFSCFIHLIYLWGGLCVCWQRNTAWFCSRDDEVLLSGHNMKIEMLQQVRVDMWIGCMRRLREIFFLGFFLVRFFAASPRTHYQLSLIPITMQQETRRVVQHAQSSHSRLHTCRLCRCAPRLLTDMNEPQQHEMCSEGEKKQVKWRSSERIEEIQTLTSRPKNVSSVGRDSTWKCKFNAKSIWLCGNVIMRNYSSSLLLSTSLRSRHLNAIFLSIFCWLLTKSNIMESEKETCERQLM